MAYNKKNNKKKTVKKLKYRYEIVKKSGRQDEMLRIKHRLEVLSK